jgi:hypothetical protein
VVVGMGVGFHGGWSCRLLRFGGFYSAPAPRRQGASAARRRGRLLVLMLATSRVMGLRWTSGILLARAPDRKIRRRHRCRRRRYIDLSLRIQTLCHRRPKITRKR